MWSHAAHARDLSLAAFLVCFFASHETHAGAWTQEKGKAQLIVTATHYTTDERYDDSGIKRSQPDYHKSELNPYLEYGVTDTLTAGANLFLQHADDSADSSSSLGDTELFLRQRIFKSERYVFSLQPMVKLPSPTGGDDTPAIGSEHPDLGLDAQLGVNFNAFGRTHFADLSAGYRHRFGTPEDQILFSGTLGLNIAERWTVMPQLNQTLRATRPNVATFTQSPQDDYSLTRASLSAVYKISEERSMQVGAFSHIDGKNVGAGHGAMVSYWLNF
jgi:hypothetical protein